MQGLQTNYTLPNSINELIMDDCHTVQYRGVIIIFMEHFKAGFHMIADDRRSQKVLRSSAIIWKHTSAIVCDRLRSFAILRSYGTQTPSATSEFSGGQELSG